MVIIISLSEVRECKEPTVKACLIHLSQTPFIRNLGLTWIYYNEKSDCLFCNLKDILYLCTNNDIIQ